MATTMERRQWERTELDPPLIGIALANGTGSDSRDFTRADIVFTSINNISKRGIMIESLTSFPDDQDVELQFCMHAQAEWDTYRFRPVWSRPAPDSSLIRTGLAFAGQSDTSWCPSLRPGDVRFLQDTNLVDAVSSEGLLHLLAQLTRVRLRPGELLFSQGDPGDSLYLIQEGTCLVHIDRDGQTFEANRMAEGDILGEMALVTGEPRSASITAETDTLLWRLDKNAFNELITKYPDLLQFLTEIVALRFESTPVATERRIGKYLVKDRIGKGGWSLVYHGVHELLGLPVAVKMLKHDMAMVPGFREKFRSEAHIIAKLTHPHIVRVYDIEEIYRTVFIVMEYLEGKSLREVMDKSGPLPPSRVMDYLAQILSGLQYAHTKGIVHQDIKPENIFIQPGGSVKLTDFGLACSPGTEVIGMCGTVLYAPPEQLEHGQVVEQSDIYSLGIMLYEMLTGRRPFPEDDLMRLVDMHVSYDIPDPVLVNHRIPRGLNEIVLTACRRDPNQRYQSAAEMLEELQSLKSYRPLQPLPEKTLPPMMTSVLLCCDPDRRKDLQNLLEEISRRAEKKGITVKAAEFREG